MLIKYWCCIREKSLSVVRIINCMDSQSADNWLNMGNNEMRFFPHTHSLGEATVIKHQLNGRVLRPRCMIIIHFLIFFFRMQQFLALR